MADTYNLRLDCGATAKLEFQWLDENDAPINLTGYTAKLEFRRSVSAPGAANLSLTLGSGLTMSAPATGIILAVFSAAATSALSDNYVWSFEVTSPGGEVTRLAQGDAYLNPRVNTP